MKANYTKPMLAVEMFSLTQTIARDCADFIPDAQVTFNEIGSCVWKLGGGFTVFVTGTACQYDGEALGYACYNGPTEGRYIFRS